MDQVFNTPFEMSLRVLLILEASRGESLSAEMIAALDFITVYGREYGVSERNLHGENMFRFGEFNARRSLVTAALKNLVLEGNVKAKCGANGFHYMITEPGQTYGQKLESDYAMNYRAFVIKAFDGLADKSEREVHKRLQSDSIHSLQRGAIGE